MRQLWFLFSSLMSQRRTTSAELRKIRQACSGRIPSDTDSVIHSYAPERYLAAERVRGAHFSRKSPQFLEVGEITMRGLCAVRQCLEGPDEEIRNEKNCLPSRIDFIASKSSMAASDFTT